MALIKNPHPKNTKKTNLLCYNEWNSSKTHIPKNTKFASRITGKCVVIRGEMIDQEALTYRKIRSVVKVNNH